MFMRASCGSEGRCTYPDSGNTSFTRHNFNRLHRSVNHMMESYDVMNIHVVEHSILNGIEYCTFWFCGVTSL
jgi:hypothetical protein